ncbi:hypothetical protein KUTeg_011005 [Tegillarca granosa]|uniref:C2H2-type domain-containing protein n=1 Tax=Tegillarca granosa TaxID=220873 RepID=A0ABQ9F5W7_TEGGR|nr:hypothetical protein KUTeg_011005 [Tegillarca granosa]
MSDIEAFLASKTLDEVKDVVKSACKKLSEHGEEAVFVTANPTQKKTGFIGSHLGSTFLSSRLQIIDDFYGYCVDVYCKQTTPQTNNEDDDKDVKTGLQDSSNHSINDTTVVIIKENVNSKTNNEVQSEDQEITMESKIKRKKSQTKKTVVSKTSQNCKLLSAENKKLENDKGLTDDENVENQSKRRKREVKKPKWNDIYMMEEKADKVGKSEETLSDVEQNSDQNENKEQGIRKSFRRRGKFACQKCGEEFGNKEQMNLHEPCEIENGNSSMPCSVCDKEFSSKLLLNRHIQKSHKDLMDLKYKCELCDEQFKTAALLKKHKHNCKVTMETEKNVNTNNEGINTDKNSSDASGNIKLEDNKQQGITVDTDNITDSEKQTGYIKLETGAESNDSADSLKRLMCHECKISFKDKRYLNRHLRRLHNLSSFICHCLKSFKSRSDLRQHVHNEHIQVKDDDEGSEKPSHVALVERKKVKCESCDVSFTTLKNLKRHMKNIHDGKNSYSSVFCDDCGKGYENTWKLKYHLRNDHKRLNVYTCQKCPQTFHTAVMYRRHKPKCDGSDKSAEEKEMDARTCKICLKILLTVKNLEQHIKSHIENPNLVCEICQKTFVNNRRLKDHYEVHKKSLDQKFNCTYCNKAFLLGRYLLRHIKEVHKEKVHVCKTCGQVCNGVQDLYEHIIQTHGPCDPNQPKRNIPGALSKSSRFICETCGKIFKQKAALRNHSAVHGSDRPYTCDKCGLSFKALGTLGIHKRYRHRTFKAYQCELCGACFKMPDTLRCHKRTHEKPQYTCEYCNKDFRSLDGFKYHMLLVHKTDKGLNQYRFRVFSCNFCGKMFGHKSNYDYHLKTHTGSRPFKCDYCDKCFPARSKLTVHMRRHTGEKTYRCDLCNVTLLTKTKYNIHLRTAKHCARLNPQLQHFSTENTTGNLTQIETIVDPMETNIVSSEVKDSLEEAVDVQDLSKTCVIDIGQQTDSYVISVDNLENPTELVESLGRIYQHEQTQVLNQPATKAYDQGHNLSEVEQIIEISIPYHVLPVPGYTQSEPEQEVVATLENVTAVQSIAQ